SFWGCFSHMHGRGFPIRILTKETPMSAVKCENAEFVLPFRPSDVAKLNRWLSTFHPDILVGDYVLDEDSLLVVDMTTYYDPDVEGVDNKDTVALNTWTAIRSGQCEHCRMFPAKHYM